MFLTGCPDDEIVEAVGLLNGLRDYRDHARVKPAEAPESPGPPRSTPDGGGLNPDAKPLSPAALAQLADGGWRMRERVERRRADRGPASPGGLHHVHPAGRELVDLPSAIQQLSSLRQAIRSARSPKAKPAPEPAAGSDGESDAPDSPRAKTLRQVLGAERRASQIRGEEVARSAVRLGETQEHLASLRKELIEVRSELSKVRAEGTAKYREQLAENDSLVEYCAAMRRQAAEHERQFLKATVEAKEAQQKFFSEVQAIEVLKTKLASAERRLEESESEKATLAQAKRQLLQVNDGLQKSERRLEDQLAKMQRDKENAGVQWRNTVADVRAKLEEAVEVAQEAGCYVSASGQLCRPIALRHGSGSYSRKSRKRAGMVTAALRTMVCRAESCTMQSHDYDAVTLRHASHETQPKRRGTRTGRKRTNTQAAAAAAAQAEREARTHQDIAFSSPKLRVQVDIGTLFAGGSRMASALQRLVQAVAHAVSELAQDNSEKLGSVWHLLRGGADSGLSHNPLRAIEDVRSAFHSACSDHLWYAEKVAMRLGEALRAGAGELSREERSLTASSPQAAPQPDFDDRMRQEERYVDLAGMVLQIRTQGHAGLTAALSRLSELGVAARAGGLPPLGEPLRGDAASLLAPAPGPAELAARATLEMITRFRELLGKPHTPARRATIAAASAKAMAAAAGKRGPRPSPRPSTGRRSPSVASTGGSTRKPQALSLPDAPAAEHEEEHLKLEGKTPPCTEQQHTQEVQRRGSFSRGSESMVSPRSLPLGPPWQPEKPWIPAGGGGGGFDDAKRRKLRAIAGALRFSANLLGTVRRKRRNTAPPRMESPRSPRTPSQQPLQSPRRSSGSAPSVPSRKGSAQARPRALTQPLLEPDPSRLGLPQLCRLALQLGVPEPEVEAAQSRPELLRKIAAAQEREGRERVADWVREQSAPTPPPALPPGSPPDRQPRSPVFVSPVAGEGPALEAPSVHEREKSSAGASPRMDEHLDALHKHALLGRGWLDGARPVMTDEELRRERCRGWAPAESREVLLDTIRNAGKQSKPHWRAAPQPRSQYQYRGRMAEYLGQLCELLGPSAPAQQVHVKFGDGSCFHWVWEDIDVLTTPERLMVRCREAPHIDGLYMLLRDGSPDGTSMPIWADGARRLFSTKTGYWMLSESEKGPKEDTGRLQTTDPHSRCLPQHTTGWQVWNGTSWVPTVTRVAEPEPFVEAAVAGALAGAQQELERLTVPEAKQRLCSRGFAAGFTTLGQPDDAGRYAVAFRDRWEVAPQKGALSYRKCWRVAEWEAELKRGSLSLRRLRKSVHVIVAGNRFKRSSAGEGPAFKPPEEPPAPAPALAPEPPDQPSPAVSLASAEGAKEEAAPQPQRERRATVSVAPLPDSELQRRLPQVPILRRPSRSGMGSGSKLGLEVAPAGSAPSGDPKAPPKRAASAARRPSSAAASAGTASPGARLLVRSRSVPSTVLSPEALGLEVSSAQPTPNPAPIQTPQRERATSRRSSAVPLHIPRVKSPADGELMVVGGGAVSALSLDGDDDSPHVPSRSSQRGSGASLRRRSSVAVGGVVAVGQSSLGTGRAFVLSS
eukprot:TRINITY_DN24391_c0_g1_i1.p1 TRINITY_DN24391_c0_g1~~TRINITY_DN24391_c0_g1_i1.p1  ORF type:complete len:1581 (+),score=517.72 TRINITY_DN24391_c0_g1_i1:293-5035(+)